MTKPKKTVEQLALEHWAYIESVLLESARMQMKLYTSAFIHGHKHGKEDKNGVRSRPSKK